MLKPHEPVSNVERQRQFRERNPGYFRKYYARLKEIERVAAEQAAAGVVPSLKTGADDAPSPALWHASA